MSNIPCTRCEAPMLTGNNFITPICVNHKCGAYGNPCDITQLVDRVAELTAQLAAAEDANHRLTAEVARDPECVGRLTDELDRALAQRDTARAQRDASGDRISAAIRAIETHGTTRGIEYVERILREAILDHLTWLSHEIEHPQETP